MIVADVIVAIVIGLVFAFLVYLLLDVSRGWLAWLVVFLLFMLLPWFGGLWLPPFGPPLFGAYWLPPVVIAVFVFLILAAFTPTRPPRSRREEVYRAREAAAAGTTISLFFWMLVILAVAGIVVAYVI